MENMVKTVYVSTKRFAEDDAVKTKLTIDASSLTAEEMLEYVIDAATIKWQASIRRKKDATVPAEATYIVPKPGMRATAVLTPTQKVIEIFGAAKAEILINKAGSAEKVIETMKGMFPELAEE